MRSAAFWAGKITRSQQSYDTTSTARPPCADSGDALEPEELSPRNMGRPGCRCRGPGRMKLFESTSFREVPRRVARGAAARSCRRTHGSATSAARGQASRDSGGVQASHGAVRRCCSFDGHRRDRRCGAATRDDGRSAPAAARKWCSAMEAQSTSSPVTASWLSSARQQLWRTTLFVPAWRPWVSRTRRSGLPSTSKIATVSTCGCGWA